MHGARPAVRDLRLGVDMRWLLRAIDRLGLRRFPLSAVGW